MDSGKGDRDGRRSLELEFEGASKYRTSMQYDVVGQDQDYRVELIGFVYSNRVSTYLSRRVNDDRDAEYRAECFHVLIG